MSMREYISQRRWHSLGPILPGGTIYALTLSPNKEQYNPLIAGTPVGAFRSLSRGEQWSWANRGLAGLQVSALATSPNGVLFLGTLDGTLARSVDGGFSWLCLPRLEDSGSITALAVSPDYMHDGTVLIGTENAGVFRSTDSGRTAKPVNFGLIELSVLSLCCPPGWPRQAIAFAGTVDGLYRSTNGGRAWRACRGEPEGLSVQVLAASPRFNRDGIVFAGTEEDGLYRSQDGGATWEPVGQSIPDATINAIWVSPEFQTDRLVLVGTSSSGLHRSADGGDTWEPALDIGNAVLALAGDAQAVFAGFHAAGAYRSLDAGATWEEAREGFHANAFTQITQTGGGRLIAAGPDTGVFVSSDGSTWEELPSLPNIAGLAAFACSPDYDREPTMAIADVQAGLHVSSDGGQSWEQVLPHAVTALAATRDSDGLLGLWAGTADGRILESTDGGKSWNSRQPFDGQMVLQIEPSPAFATDRTLVTATRDTGDPSSPLTLWRTNDGGDNWSRIVQEEVTLSHVNVAIDPDQQGRIAAALDRYCLIEQGPEEWRRVALGPGDPPVLSVALRRSADEALMVLGTTVGAFVADDAESWTPMMRGMGAVPVLAFAPKVGTDDDRLWALGLGGLVYRWDRSD